MESVAWRKGKIAAPCCAEITVAEIRSTNRSWDMVSNIIKNSLPLAFGNHCGWNLKSSWCCAHNKCNNSAIWVVQYTSSLPLFLTLVWLDWHTFGFLPVLSDMWVFQTRPSWCSLAAVIVCLLIVPSWFHVKESEFVDMIPVIGKMCRVWLVSELDKPLLSGDD